MRSLCGLFFFGASHPTRVRRNARKRQRPAFDGASPTKANGDRVISTRPAGASSAVETAVDVLFAEANSSHDVDILSVERISHPRRDTTLLCGSTRISMQLEHSASPVRRNECEICIEHRRHGDPSGSGEADRQSLCQRSRRIACYSHAMRIRQKRNPPARMRRRVVLLIYRMLRRSSSRSFSSRSMATSRSVSSSASMAMRIPSAAACRAHAAASLSRRARSLLASPLVRPAM